MNITTEQLKKLKQTALNMENAAFNDGKAQATDMRSRNFHRSLRDEAHSEFLDVILDILAEDGDV